MASEHHPAPHPFSNLLLFSGSCLIIVAMLVLVSSSWQNLGSSARVIIAALPLVALYVIGLSTRKQPTHESLSFYTLLTASIIFPFVLGTVLWQSGISHPAEETVTAGFIALVSGLSLIWLIASQLILRLNYLSIVISLNLVACGLSYGDHISAPGYYYPLFAIAIACLCLPLAWQLDRNGQENDAGVYTYLGLISGLLGLSTLPIAYFSEGPELAVVLSYAGISALLFLVAILYSYEWQERSSRLALVSRQAAEQFSALFLTIPPLFAVASSDNANTILVSLILSLASLALGMMVRIRTFTIIGTLVLIFSVIKVVLFALDDAAAIWPVLLLIVGFLLIGGAYLLQQEPVVNRLKSIWQPSTDSLFGLGINPEPERFTHPNASRITKQAAPNGNVNWQHIIIALIVLYILFQLSGWSQHVPVSSPPYLP